MSAPALGTPARGEGSAPWRLARFLRTTLGRLFLRLYRTRFFGEEHLPLQGGYIVAGNHVSYLDPMLLWCGTPQPTHFLARKELFDAPFLRWLLPRVWCLPISRASADREGIQRATALLKRGECVGIFPEGTRQVAAESGETALGEAHAGVAFIAIRAGVPVVPVGLWGTQHALPRGAKVPRFPRVTIRYGEPVEPQAFSQYDRQERLQAMTAEIMRRVAQARDEAEKE
jgi:1-acyl-sn-glycerol-3-phosphate acyltransferase